MHVCVDSSMRPVPLSRHCRFDPSKARIIQPRPMNCQCTTQQNEHPANCMRQVQHKHRQSLHATVAAAASLIHVAAAHASDASPSGDAAGDMAAAVGKFEPQFNPGLLVVALVAATPPVLFWGRIFLSALKRQRQIDQEKQAEDLRQKERDELKRKLWGEK